MVHEHIGKISPRKEDSHKGDYGRVLVVAGSRGMTGAACLCCMGALRAGSGLVKCAVPHALNTIMEIKLTEAMTLPLPGNKDGTAFGTASLKGILSFSGECDVVAAGPGLGASGEVKKLVSDMLKKITAPLVLDADGLNAIAGKMSILKKRNAATVLTPHVGEMARMMKKDAELIGEQRLEMAKELASDTGCVVCLKGHKTVIAEASGRSFVNNTGNSGMATGGSGDVLTGIIASFIGQGLEPYSASVSAVYLHGLAGDIACQKKGAFSMIASDIIECLPEAFAKSGI
jgi:ADP-dependent NAD(P)H-hydrate dehydratase / NAD(P)H-hydrate epimerase